MGREPEILAAGFVRRVEMISDAGHIDQTMRIPGDDTDRPWRKSRLAARILFRKEAGRMTARDQRIGRRLAQDPEVTNRLIQQGIYSIRYQGRRIGDRKHEFDQNLGLVAR